jgi:hypothetical protein
MTRNFQGEGRFDNGPQVAGTAIKVFIKKILERLEQAAGVANSQAGLAEPLRGRLRPHRLSTTKAKTCKK